MDKREFLKSLEGLILFVPAATALGALGVEVCAQEGGAAAAAPAMSPASSRQRARCILNRSEGSSCSARSIVRNASGKRCSLRSDQLARYHPYAKSG